MADIIQVEPGHYHIDHLAGQKRPQFRDKYFILLVVLALLALLTAVALGVYTRFLYDETVAFIGVQTLIILQVLLGILAIALYIAAVWRALNNVSLQARAGCPSCQQQELLRISRTRRDRLITLSGIRVARYQCRDCRWNGRRVFKTSYNPVIRMEIQKDLDAAYVQPQIVPVSKPVQPVQPESLPEEFDTNTEFAQPVVTIDEPEVETLDLKMQASELDAAVDQTVTPQTSEVLDNAIVDQPIIDEVQSESLTEIKENVRPQKAEEETTAADLAQEAVPIWGGTAKINTKFGINLKEEPRSDSRWVGLLGPETIVSLNKRKMLADGTVWYLVNFQDQSGWVESSCLEMKHKD
jgi:hypothetical protein